MRSLTWFNLVGRLTATGTSVAITRDNRGNVVTLSNESVVAVSDDLKSYEMMQIDAAAGVLSIIKRGLDNSNTKTEVPANKKERGPNTKIYITALASDFVSSNTANIWTAKQTFGDVDIAGLLNILALGNTNVIGKSNPQPNFATTAERDALYTSPQNGDKCTVGGYEQTYNGYTAQRETFGIATPVPDATEVVKGKIRKSTDAEALAGLNDDSAMTPKKVQDKINAAIQPATNQNHFDYLLAEACSGNARSVMTDFLRSFASATTLLHVGDVDGNKRQSIKIIGGNVSANTLKLAISKIGAPAVSLGIRIELDDGTGKPSGSLVNANATSSVAPAGITGSLVDTIITLVGNLTLDLGVTYHVVIFQGTYGAETVNALDYYNIGITTDNSKVRGILSYNGTDWLGVKFTSNGFLTSFYATPTYGTLTDSVITFGGTGLGSFGANGIKTANVISGSKIAIIGTCDNTPSFVDTESGVELFWDANNYARIRSIDNNNAGTNNRIIDIVKAGVSQYTTTVAGTFNASYTLKILKDGDNISFYVWSGSAWTQLGTTQTVVFTGSPYGHFSGYCNTGSSTVSNPSIITNSDIIEQAPVDYAGNMPYISSSLILDGILIKTDANYSYKLPVDFVRILDGDYSVGSVPNYIRAGFVDNLTLDANSNYFISNVPGELSKAQGTNVYPVGGTILANQLLLDKKITFNPTVGASPFVFRNFSKEKSIQYYVSGGTVNPIQISKNGTTYITQATATNYIGILAPGDYLKITYTVAPTLSISVL